MLKESLLVVENERLKAENEKLQLKHSEEFNRLRAEVQRLKKENDKLKAENKELERKYQRILKQLEKHKKKEANTWTILSVTNRFEPAAFLAFSSKSQYTQRHVRYKNKAHKKVKKLLSIVVFNPI